MKQQLKSEDIAELTNGIAKLKLVVSETQLGQLIKYLELLILWNEKINLTAIRDPQKMITKHLLDSLAIVPYITGDKIIDVGTGGGLPGVPLAIVLPEKKFTLLDSNGKKIRFLTQVQAQLGLHNVQLQYQRAEDYQPTQFYDCVLSRAFASLKQMLLFTQHLAGQQSIFLAMKGVYPQEEIDALDNNYKILNVVGLDIPGINAARHLVIITRKSAVPALSGNVC